MLILNPLINVVQVALNIYFWVIIISAILSWLVAFNVVNTRNQAVSMIGNALFRLTEPALRPIRRFMPNLGGVDISPVILLLAIYFIQSVLVNIQYRLNFG